MPRRLSGPPFGGPTPRCERRNFVTDNVGSVIDRVYVRFPLASQSEASHWKRCRVERTRGFLLDRATLWSQCSLSVETPVIALVRVIIQ